MITLKNELLTVGLCDDRPVVAGYRHAPTGAELKGATADGILAINGKPVAWSSWKIAVDASKDAASYRLALPEEEVKLSISFRLASAELVMDLAVLDDPRARLKTVDWPGLAILTYTDTEFDFWIDEKAQQNWSTQAGGGAGLYWAGGEKRGRIRNEIPDGAPRTAGHGSTA